MSVKFKIKSVFSDTNNSWDVLIKGDIDIESAEILKKEIYNLLDEKGQYLMLNLKEVNYIDSTGIGILTNMLKDLRLNNRELVLLNPKESVAKLFNITGLSKVFNIR